MKAILLSVIDASERDLPLQNVSHYDADNKNQEHEEGREATLLLHSCRG